MGKYAIAGSSLTYSGVHLLDILQGGAVITDAALKSQADRLVRMELLSRSVRVEMSGGRLSPVYTYTTTGDGRDLVRRASSVAGGSKGEVGK